MKQTASGGRGQSTVEYMLVVAMMLLLALYGIRKVLQKKMTTNLDNAGGVLSAAMAKWKSGAEPPE